MKTNLINKTDYTTKVLNNRGTGESCKFYSKLSDDLMKTITDKYYKTDNINEFGEDELIDLHLVTGFDDVDTGETFKEVTKLEFKDRDEAIQTYLDNLTDLTYHRKKYKVEVADFKRYNASKYRTFTTLCDNDPDILVVVTKDIATRKIKGDIFLDVIEEGDMAMLESGVYDGTSEKVFELIPNPARVTNVVIE